MFYYSKWDEHESKISQGVCKIHPSHTCIYFDGKHQRIYIEDKIKKKKEGKGERFKGSGRKK